MLWRWAWILKMAIKFLLFFLLSSTLYKDPYRAIVRELVSNAIDASKAVSTSEVGEAQPVILNVPKTIDSNDFYVQDFGIITI